MSYAPIILFIYNRPDHTRQTLEALSKNTLAQESELFIYADGPKDNAAPEQLERIKQTRDIARSKKWCKNVTIIESEKNKGLACSIITGVTDIVSKYIKLIGWYVENMGENSYYEKVLGSMIYLREDDIRAVTVSEDE